jgi:hypothetical protein
LKWKIFRRGEVIAIVRGSKTNASSGLSLTDARQNQKKTWFELGVSGGAGV